MEPVLKQLLLKDNLVLGPEIGKGSFGTVYRCTDVKTQISYAVKKIDLRVLRMQPHFMMARLKRECQVLQELHHPCVVRLLKTIESEDAILMVMEMVLGMELFEMIIAVNGLSETEACAVFVQISSALAYMHARGVVHRDIKPENILVQGSTGMGSDMDQQGQQGQQGQGPDAFRSLKPRVKLIDFGLSKVLGSDKGGSVAKSLVGTPRYVAPEIVAIGERMQNRNRDLDQSRHAPAPQSYTEKVDCFSAGVLLHVTLAACFPQFDAHENVVFTDPRIARASPAAKQLITALMAPNPSKRMSIAQALAHEWVQSLHPRAAAIGLELASLTRHTHSQQQQQQALPVEGSNFFELEKAKRDKQQQQQTTTTTSSGASFAPDDVVSMYVSPSIANVQQQKGKGEQQQGVGGIKRQLSKGETRGDWSPSPVGSSLSVAPPPHSGSTSTTPSQSDPRYRARKQSVGSGSKNNSIEVLDLPGAKEGVWGPFQEQRTSSGDLATNNDGSREEVIDGVFAAQGELRDLVEDETNSGPGVRRRSPASAAASTPSPSTAGAGAAAEQDVDMGGADSDGDLEDLLDEDHLSAGIAGALVIPRPVNGLGVGSSSSQLDSANQQVDPAQLGMQTHLLLQLQTKIAMCFKKSFDAFKDDDVVMPGLVSSTVASRELLTASDTLLEKLENTSHSVLDVLPDMRVAVEEGEFEMALALFATIKDWIRNIQSESQDLLKANVKVISAVNSTLQLGRRRQRVKAATNAGFRVTDALALEQDVGTLADDSADEGTGASGGAVEAAKDGHRASTDALKKVEMDQVREERLSLSSPPPHAVMQRQDTPPISVEEMTALVALDQRKRDDLIVKARGAGDANAGAGDGLEPITMALGMLQQIDRLLQKHAKYWSRMEVVVDTLMQQTQSAEGMVNYTRNPRLRGRFLTRVDQYSVTWDRISQMCAQFRVSTPSRNRDGDGDNHLYGFITE